MHPAEAPLSPEQLRALVTAARGPQFVTFVARVDARLRKKSPVTGAPNLLGDVTKVSRVNGVINFDYGRAVRSQQLREGAEAGEANFQPLPRAWGARIPGTPLIEHRGNLYLEVKVERVFSCRYQDAQQNELTAEQVAPFLPKKPAGNAGHQGVRREIILRDYALGSIESITLNGRTFPILHPTPPAEGASPPAPRPAASEAVTCN